MMMQIANGLAEAVNGEGANETLLEDIGIDQDETITVLLADLFQERLSELAAEIHERIGRWRVNPFSEVIYEGGRTLKFYLKPESDIRKLYERQQW